MDKRKTAILLPSAYRAFQLARCVQSIQDTIGHLRAEIIASPVITDYDSRAYLTGCSIRQIVRSEDEYQRGAVYAWNLCLQAAPDFDFYVLGADDLVFYAGALQDSIDAIDRAGGCGLAGFNDLSSDGAVYAAHWLASRDFLIKHAGGVVFPPIYRSWWCDREITDIAQAAGIHRFVKSAIVEHLHYTFQKAPVDRVYADAQGNYESDRVLYEQRKAIGFPVTWEPIIQ
jgi:hypothetical protein